MEPIGILLLSQDGVGVSTPQSVPARDPSFPCAGAVLCLAQTYRGKPQTTSTRLYAGGELQGSLSLSCIGEGNGNPLQCSCLENPSDGGAWWAAVYGVAMILSTFSCTYSVQFICSVVSNSLQSHELKHARLPYPSPTPRACSNSCPSNR